MKSLTYKITKYSTKSDKQTVGEGIRQGLEMWLQRIPSLQFKQVYIKQDISIEFSETFFQSHCITQGQIIGNSKILLSNMVYWSLDGKRINVDKDDLNITVNTTNLPIVVVDNRRY